MSNGTTINGRIDYPSANKVLQVGQRGGERPAKPQASQVGAMGAKDPGTGRKHAPGEYGNGTIAGGDDVEPGSKGTSSEEQRARLARRMYPSSVGTRYQQKAGL